MQKTLHVKIKSPGEKWFALAGTTPLGPFSLAQLKASAANGSLPSGADVWRADIPVRVPAGCLPWLFPAGKPGAFDPGAGLPPEPEIACPACGAHFVLSQALFVARDPRLPPDPLLHAGEPYRFLPSRFSPDGSAFDPCGMLSDESACPACHASLTGPARPLPAATAAGPLANSAAVRTLAGARPPSATERLPSALASADGIRQLIADIRGLLGRQITGRASGDTLARQYAELCRLASVRLDLCARLSSSGMREEATRQANTPPQLSEVCAALAFPELDDWRQLCARNRWAIPSRVDAAAAQAIESAEGVPAALDATLQAFRHAVSTRRYDMCVRLLHTLMLMDIENPRWREDAAGFEACRQQELVAAGQAAVAADDLPRLTELMRELNGPWVKPPETSVLNPLNADFLRMRQADAKARGRALAGLFASACRNRDVAAAAAAAAEYEGLVKSGLLVADEDTRADWESGQAWYREACAQKEASDRLARDLAAFEAELAKPEPSAALEGMLSALVAAGASVDGSLRQRAEASIALRKRRERMRRLRRRAAQATVALLGLALLAGGAWWIARTHQSGVWQANLTPFLDAGDDLGFDRELASLKRGCSLLLRESLVNSRDLAAMRLRRDALAARRLQSEQDYAAASPELQAIEAAAFDDPQGRVPALLSQSRKPPVPRTRQAWLDAYETRWRTNQTLRLSTILASLPTPAAISGIFAAHPFARARQDAEMFIRQANEALLLTGADASTRSRLTPFTEAAQVIAEGLTNRLAAIDSMDRAATLSAYFDGLTRYATRFEADWLSVRLDSVLAGRDLSLVALDPAQDFSRRRTAIAESDAWMKVRRALSDLHNSRSLTDLRWVKRKGVDDLAFLLGIEKDEPNLKGKWAAAYLPVASGLQPEFQRAMILDSVPWGRGLSDAPSKPFKHTEIVRDMLDKVTSFTRAEDGESYLEELFRRVAAMPVWKGNGVPGDNELLNVCFKVQFLAFIAEHLAALSALPEWQEISNALKVADDPGVSWVCFRTTRVRDVDRRGAETLTAIFAAGGPAQRMNVRRAAQQLAMRTPLVWTGHADRDDPSRMVWRAAPPPAGSAGIVRIETRAGKPHAVMKTLSGENAPALFPGQPILAWSDGAPVSQRLRELAVLLPDSPPSSLPASLPEWFPRP